MRSLDMAGHKPGGRFHMPLTEHRKYVVIVQRLDGKFDAIDRVTHERIAAFANIERARKYADAVERCSETRCKPS